MLQAIRGQVGSWIVKILFAFLILSFAVWGIGDIFRGAGPDEVVAEVGEAEITLRDVNQAFDEQLRQLRQSLGPDIDEQTAISLGLLDRSLNTLVNAALIQQAAADVGVQPPDEMLFQLVRQQEVFQDPETGRFSRDRFERVLAGSGLSEAGYLQSVRSDFARRVVTGAVATGTAVPDVLADQLLRFEQEGRVAEIVSVDAAAMADRVPDATDADLVAYHESNADRFTAPEYREISVVVFTAEDLADEIQISEQDLLDEYHARADLYQRDTPVRRFEQVLLGADQQSLAAELSGRAREGMGLDEAAQAVGADAVSAIPLDWTTEDEMLPALAEPAFALEEGGVSDPIQSPFGWHVLKVTDVMEDGVLPFEAVREEVEEAARLDRALDSLFEVANAFDDELAGGASLEDAAASLGFDVAHLPDVSADGETRHDEDLPALPAFQSVLDTAFEMAEGELSTLRETEQRDGYFIVRVDRVIDPALRPLSEVREQVEAGWRAEQRLSEAREVADMAADRLARGDAAATVAADLPAADAARTDALVRDGSNRGDWPPALVDRLFAIEPDAVAVVQGEDRVLAARLAEIVPADPDEEQLAEARRLATRSMADDLLNQFAAGLRQVYEVDIDREALEGLRGS